VELDFSAGGARYRVERTPPYTATKLRGSGTTEKLAAAALFRVLGTEQQPVASRTGEVTREVERIVGLNAAQFRQVILLPQGRFAEVLRAKAEEREALLKTLFETEIHERAGSWLEDQARTAQRAIEEQKRHLAWLREQAAQEWLPFADQPHGRAEGEGASRSQDSMGAERPASASDPGTPTDQAGLDQLLERIRRVVAACEESRRRATEALEQAQRQRAAVVQAADRFDRRAAARTQLAQLEPQQPAIEALALQLAAADRAEALRPSLEADQAARRDLQDLGLRLRRELERAAAVRDGARGLPDAVVALGLLSLPESTDLQRARTVLATRRVEVEGLARQAEEARPAEEALQAVR
jgi:exonuclease SbcC